MFFPIKRLSQQAYFSRDKHVFVATKMILVAAPANDSQRLSDGSFADGYLTIHWRRIQVHPLINKPDFKHLSYRPPPSSRALRKILVADNVSVYICEQVLFVYVLQIIPPRITDQRNFITVLIITREPEQTTLLF